MNILPRILSPSPQFLRHQPGTQKIAVKRCFDFFHTSTCQQVAPSVSPYAPQVLLLVPALSWGETSLRSIEKWSVKRKPCLLLRCHDQTKRVFWIETELKGRSSGKLLKATESYWKLLKAAESCCSTLPELGISPLVDVCDSLWCMGFRPILHSVRQPEKVIWKKRV